MTKIERILVPVDFSHCSARALDAGVELARALDGEILLLHVWEPPRFMGPEAMFFPSEQSEESIARAVHADAQRRMEDLVAESPKGRDVRIETRIETGIAFTTIVDVASRESADLIVMGTQGRTGLSRFLLGSVAERVVRYATCPVLTIRDPECGAEPPGDTSD